MGVSPDLLNAAAANDPAANDMVNLWGFGARAGRGGAEAPGLWMTGAGGRILRHIIGGGLGDGFLEFVLGHAVLLSGEAAILPVKKL